MIKKTIFRVYKDLLCHKAISIDYGLSPSEMSDEEKKLADNAKLKFKGIQIS